MSIKEVFDCGTLIVEVEKRPPLYDFQLKEYSDKNIKEKLWSEVCEAVVSDWNTLSPESKNEKGKQVQRRWKNLRECFRRELKAQKGRSGDGATNKRKYVYFDQLLFLARTFNERETTGNYSAPKCNDDEERGESETPSNSTNVDIPERAYKQKKIHGCSNNRYEEELIEILREKSKGDCDKDKAFVMSLLPKSKKFNNEQRFEAQLEIMKVMRRVQLMPTQVPSTAYHGNVPSTSNFQPYVAAPGMSQHTQTDLPTNNIQHMHQHQIGEGHHPTQELVHVRGYLHNQPHQPQLHHSHVNLEFSQPASNINANVLSPASERSVNSCDTELFDLS